MNLDSSLLEILACPQCKSPLRVDEPAEELVCTDETCGLAYPVRDDIPVLLVDEARRPGEQRAGHQPADDSAGNSAGESGRAEG